jgi:hypothetical protein
MKRLFKHIQCQFGKLFLLGMTAATMVSCNSVLDFNEGDCTYQYKIKFKYDYNMKYADAFHSLVSTVTLYAFDKDGKFVYQKTDEGDQLKDNNYAMSVALDPGTYHLVTWAGLNNQSFAVPLLTPGSSTIQDLTVKTRRVSTSRGATSYGKEGDNIVNKQLFDLWHGELQNTTVLSRASGRDTIITVPLIKNTNTVRIVIVQTSDKDTPVANNKALTRAFDTNTFSYTLCDNNGFMNYDNTLLADSLLTYQPYLVADSTITTRSEDNTAKVLKQITGRADDSQSFKAVVAEISTARLLTSQTPQLSIINNNTGEELLPTTSLIKYLNLLKESNYSNMGLQEYLDREDHFDMVLFVKGQTLINTVVVINNWIVQLNNINL